MRWNGPSLVASDQWILMPSVIEHLMAADLQALLRLVKHGLQHPPERGIKGLLGQFNNILRDTLAYQEFSAFIREIVAVVLDQIVCGGSEARANVS